jgi:hypothetical protein
MPLQKLHLLSPLPLQYAQVPNSVLPLTQTAQSEVPLSQMAQSVSPEPLQMVQLLLKSPQAQKPTAMKNKTKIHLDLFIFPALNF